MKKFKSLTQIRRECAVYFVSCNDQIAFESTSLLECKEFLCRSLVENFHEDICPSCTFIGMYNITID